LIGPIHDRRLCMNDRPGRAGRPRTLSSFFDSLAHGGIEGFGDVEADRMSQPTVLGAVGCANSVPRGVAWQRRGRRETDFGRGGLPIQGRFGRVTGHIWRRSHANASCRLTKFDARHLLDACNIVARYLRMFINWSRKSITTGADPKPEVLFRTFSCHIDDCGPRARPMTPAAGNTKFPLM
jgi:hypothetical protein